MTWINDDLSGVAFTARWCVHGDVCVLFLSTNAGIETSVCLTCRKFSCNDNDNVDDHDVDDNGTGLSEGIIYMV